MVKVVHTVTAYQSVITILSSKLRNLNKFGDLDVIVISSPQGPCQESQPTVKFLPVYIYRKIRVFSDLKTIFMLYKIIKREKPDIVHSHTAKAGFLTAVSAHMVRVPVICHTYHGLPFYKHQRKILYFIYFLLEKIACQFRDHVFTQNNHDMKQCFKLMGSEERVSFEGNGVDIDFVTESARKQLPRASKHFACKGFTIALLSRLEPVKRVGDFFRVVDNLRNVNVNVSCVVAGTGILENDLRNKIRQMGLDDRINMIGFCDCPHGLIAASDLVVLCSEKEGIPRSLMEAMALGKPVVATDVLGTQELIVNGETGFLVPLGNIEAMTEKVMYLVNDIKLRTKMGACGLERVQRHFNENQIVEFLHQFYLSKAKKDK